ncbi:MAG: hypothetical protein AB6733_12315 [Clostridiaceae bacterium]
MLKNKTKMRFETIQERDMQLKAFRPGSFTIDKKNPLIVWLNF